MIVTSEYIFNNLKLEETNEIIKNTLLKHDERYGYICNKKVKVKCNTKFFDKIKNDTKKIAFKCCNVFGAINKVMHSSTGFIKLTGPIKLMIILERKMNKTIINTYLRSVINFSYIMEKIFHKNPKQKR